MTLLDNLRGYSRFAVGLHKYLRQPLTLDDARRHVVELEELRIENFLRLLEGGVFGHLRSPFLKLMQHAGVTYADVAGMVNTQGIESTLRSLYEAGIYVTFEEFKGRKPIVRGNLVLDVTSADFANPHNVAHYYTTSGGSTGAGTRISQDLDYQRLVAMIQNISYAAHGVFHVPTAIWRGILPDGSGMNNIFRLATLDHAPDVWFTPNRAEPFRRGYLKYALVSYLFVIASRMYGTPVPWPRHVPLESPHIVAQWAEDTLKRHDRCFILTTASRGLRVGLAATQAGIDLTGAVFQIAGEPVTRAKVEGILQAGGEVFTSYGASEVSRIGLGCADPTHHTDVHVFSGTVEVYSQPIEVPGFDAPVPAICVTTLHPAAPFILLNYLSDDYGIIEQRQCGCSLGELGLNRHIHHIYSYSKLTGEGVTLAGSDMIHVLEDVLPERFGGTSLDYQLHEVEDEQGFIRFNLVVSPRVPLADEQDVIDAMMQHLRTSSVAADVARDIWHQAQTIRIKREEPVWTARGKFYPIRKLQCE